MPNMLPFTCKKMAFGGLPFGPAIVQLTNVSGFSVVDSPIQSMLLKRSRFAYGYNGN